MEITAKLMEYRFQFIIAIVLGVVVAFTAYAAPRIVNVIAYFWPLLASTAAILTMVVAFGGVQKLSGESDGEKSGEGLMDYVAGRPHYHDDTHKYE